MIINESKVVRFPSDTEAREYYGSDVKGYWSHGDYIVTNVDKLSSSSTNDNKSKKDQQSSLVRNISGTKKGYILTTYDGKTYAGRKGIAHSFDEIVVYFTEDAARKSLSNRTGVVFDTIKKVTIVNGRIK